MSDMSNLKKAVEAARGAYGRSNDRHMRCRKHLMSLINILEQNLREKRVELSQNEAERKRLIQEYKQLRHMQVALVLALEDGHADGPGLLPAASGAKLEAGLCETPLPLDPVEIDHAPSRNESSEIGPFQNGVDDSDDARNGLKRVIRKRRSRFASAVENEESAPAI